LHGRATIVCRRESVRRFLHAEHDLRRNPRAISESPATMPETNRKRWPRRTAAMSMCWSCCVETRSFPYTATIAGGSAGRGCPASCRSARSAHAKILAYIIYISSVISFGEMAAAMIPPAVRRTGCQPLRAGG
jgi:hypothetical protein